MSSKIMTAAQAVADIPDGASIAAGGFGLCGIPQILIEALAARDVGNFEVFSNNAGVDGKGLGMLLENGKLRRIVSSYVGENKEFARQYLAGELEVELTPQGTLAERMRAGGSGIGAFYTRTGVGTYVADGGMPWKYDSEGGVAVASPPKETREIRGHAYVLEQAIEADYSLVRAAVADRSGNLRFNLTARNFSPLAAMAGRVCIVEAEKIVEVGELAPDDIHLPGIFVHRLVELTPEQVAQTKWIEKTTTNPPSEGQR
ncbi:CoA transferase subunit A [Dietzia sp. ANT_WB102]|uniref:CoA transferase subunit A n=1 Tax=Dietzia sp. ANT_WB102 TaxID=2597345 RepID=UPI0011ECC0FC|nr:CoA transferase subunit A [Dietzia sp. ANT_WB102]KAA0919178.1 CoA transferase subunit A [Dietzia sp. ANT_WB102]